MCIIAITMKPLRIAVYCSSRPELPQAWQDAARQVGRRIGELGATLVYGGVDAGLMSIVAHSAKDAGAQIVGVIPSRLLSRVCEANDIKLSTGSLHERKQVMDIMSDIFIVLPGGYGTLDEFANTFSYLNFTRQWRPIILMNLDGIYDHLLEQLAVMRRHGLLKPETMEVLHVCNNIEEFEPLLTSLITE